MIKKLKNSQGFTLVELLITTILISIVSLVIAGFLTVWLQSYGDARARTELLTEAQLALDKINSDIRLSGAADAANRWPDNNAPGAPANLYSWSSDADTLALARAAMDTNRNIIFSDPNKYITAKFNVIYYISGDELYRRVLQSTYSEDASITTCPPAEATSTCPADNLVADNVTSFSIKYYDASGAEVTPNSARSINLTIELTEQSGSKNIVANYSTRMVFRND